MMYLTVAVGGAVGAVARYGLSGWLQAATGSLYPVGTLGVNAVGSFIIGILLQLTTDRFMLSPELRLFTTTGFCGGLTTFSTFSYETLILLEDQQWGAAAGNVLLNVAVCRLLCYLGIVAARAL